MQKIGNLVLHTQKDAESAAKEAALRIYEFIESARVKNRKVLFLTSGGSAFTILDYFPEEMYGPEITIGMLDERFDPTNKTNQFSALVKTEFYKTAVKKNCTFINTSVKAGQTHEAFTKEFKASLKKWRSNNIEGSIIATIGIGADGHISGIMPFPENPNRFDTLFAGSSWVTGYNATGKNPYPLRTTTTLTFLKTIDHPVIYATGDEKVSALCQMIQNGPTASLPARFLLTLDGDMYIDESLSKDAGFCLNSS